MCTVTYVPSKKGFVFTSNRDEQASRETITPRNYKEGNVNLFYPKDEVAGGTWIGLSEYKRLVCLLNGGFVYHNPAIKFAKSRGVIVKSILTSSNLLETLDTIDLTDVAPFTLVVVDWNEDSIIYELVWCKGKKKVTKLTVDEPYVWSSSTLYTDDVKILRKKWFDKNVVAQDGLIKENVLKFHQNETLGDSEIAPKMKRNIVETISTTMVINKEGLLSMEYHDYVNDEVLQYDNLFTPVNV